MNMTKRVLFRICAAIIISAFPLMEYSTAKAQTLNVNFDYSTFRYDSTKTYMELYYSFSGRAVRLVKKDLAFTGLLLFEVSIKPLNADTITSQQIWKVPFEVADTSTDSLNHSLVGEISTALLPGKYKLFINVMDENDSTNIDTIRENIDVPQYLSDKLCMSDIELCSSITSDETNGQSMFYKNTYDVIPNPTGIYGLGMPIVYYYFEVYNIAQKPGDTTFTIGYQIRDSFGDVYKNYTKTRKKFAGSSVEVGTVNASNLKTGAYTIIFNVTDSASNLFATSSKRFFIYNPNLGTPVTPSSSLAGGAVLSSVFAVMGEDQLDNEFAEARYIATSNEMDQYKKLHGVDAKRQFMYDFWQKRDSTEYNVSDQRSDYMQRVTYANDHYRTGYRPVGKRIAAESI